MEEPYASYAAFKIPSRPMMQKFPRWSIGAENEINILIIESVLHLFY